MQYSHLKNILTKYVSALNNPQKIDRTLKINQSLFQVLSWQIFDSGNYTKQCINSIVAGYIICEVKGN